MTTEVQPSREIVLRVESLLRGRRSVDWHRVNRGYTAALRYVVTFDDGGTAFVKAGTDEQTADALRHEYEHVYGRVVVPWLPEVYGWDAEGETPVLVLEDLSGGYWPPPWTQQRIEAVLTTLKHVHSTEFGLLPHLADLTGERPLGHVWHRVAADPAPFLSLGLCTPSWLDAALPKLQSSALSVLLDGWTPLHLDVRSDNICFQGNRVVLIDWAGACFGRGDFDIAWWLPSLESEGGPAPETIMPNEYGYAALVSGYFAENAASFAQRHPADVFNLRLSELRTALPWAVRALDLPPIDGR